MIRRFGALGAVALVLALACAGGGAHASTFKVIHVFQGGTTDGANPVGNLILDADGNLYGTTEIGGVCSGAGGGWAVAPCFVLARLGLVKANGLIQLFIVFMQVVLHRQKAAFLRPV